MHKGHSVTVVLMATVEACEGRGGGGSVSDGMGGGWGRWHIPTGSAHEGGGMHKSHSV